MIQNLNEIKENAYLALEGMDDENMFSDITGNAGGNTEDKRQRQARQQVQTHLKTLLKNLAEAVESAGIVNPMQKVYALTRPLDNMSLFFAALTLQML